MLSFRTYDVFTDTRYSGNPLAIVMGADDLSDAAMQTIAGEFNLSETIFIQTPDDPANTAKVRIFTPVAELPFAGHPTIGSAIMLAEDAAGSGDFDTTITLEERAGLVPVIVHRKGAHVTATLTAPIIPFMVAEPIPEANAAVALGLNDSDIGLPGHCPGVAEGGPRFVFVPVRDLDALARASPKLDALIALENRCGTDSLYAYTTGANGADYQARMFAPHGGIPEDPATGSASACLAAHLDSCGLIEDGTTDLVLHQGIEMQRPSTITLGIDRTDTLTAVRVGGSAIRVSEGMLEPPHA